MDKAMIKLSKKVECQNCNFTIALRKDDGSISYIPSNVSVLTQSKDKDTVIFSIQCPKCGCIVQLVG